MGRFSPFRTRKRNLWTSTLSVRNISQTEESWRKNHATRNRFFIAVLYAGTQKHYGLIDVPYSTRQESQCNLAKHTIIAFKLLYLPYLIQTCKIYTVIIGAYTVYFPGYTTNLSDIFHKGPIRMPYKTVRHQTSYKYRLTKIAKSCKDFQENYSE